MRDLSSGWFFFSCTMVSSSRSLFVGNIFILQPMYDKASCRDSGITCIYTIYTLKLLVTYIFLARSSSRTGNAGGLFFFPHWNSQLLRNLVVHKLLFSSYKDCPPAATTKVTEVLCSKPKLHTISVSLGKSTKIQHSPPPLNTTDRLIKYNCLSSVTTDLHLPLSMYRERSFLKIQIKPCIQDSTTVFQD